MEVKRGGSWYCGSDGKQACPRSPPPAKANLSLVLQRVYPRTWGCAPCAGREGQTQEFPWVAGAQHGLGCSVWMLGPWVSIQNPAQGFVVLC